MLFDGGIGVGGGEFRRALERSECFVEAALLVKRPAETVQIGGVVRIGLEGAADEFLGIGQILPALGPHVAEVIEGGRMPVVHLETREKMFHRIFAMAGAFRDDAVLEIEVGTEE